MIPDNTKFWKNKTLIVDIQVVLCRANDKMTENYEQNKLALVHSEKIYFQS